MKARFFILYSSYLIAHISYSQNLVPNYSFENLTSCPGTIVFSQIHKAKPWFRVTAGTADVFNICATNSQSNVPANAVGHQFPRTGYGYAGFATQISGNREYIETPLTNTFLQGRKYCITFFVSMADTMQIATSSIGAYLSNDTIMLDTLSNTLPLNMYIPQIQNPAGNFLTDKENWFPVSGIYLANGGEKFITIGNFYDNSNTPTQTVPGSQPYSYYYIDDVSVVELPEASELTGVNTVICAGDSVLLGTAQKINVSYTWQGVGIIGSGSSSWQLWVKPSVTATFTLTVSDTSVMCENSSMAYVTVTIKPLTVGPAFGGSSWQADTTICEGSSVLIGGAAKSNYAYTWSPAATLNSTKLAIPTASPQQTTTYYVTASDTSYGFTCNTVTDSVKITVINCDTLKPNSFWVPMAFSPNGDNNNEILYVYGKNINELRFEVYNRWGEKIFETNDPTKGWNGKINNENAPESVYAWYSKVKFKDREEKIYKGTVLLVR